MLHELLRSHRERAELSCAAVAQAIGVSRTVVYEWEAGAYQPGPQRIAALVRLYKLDDEAELALWRLVGAGQNERAA